MTRPAAPSEVTVRFERWTRRGEATASLGDVELRVPEGIPGEQAVVRVTGRSKGGPVAWGEIVSIPEPSPARRAAPCPIEGRCGGCGLQHVVDRAQLDLLVASHTSEMPAALAGALSEPGAWIRSAPWDWRHKAVLLPARRQGQLLLGGYGRGTHHVVNQHRCNVLAPSLRGARALLLGRMNRLRDLPLAPPGSPAVPGALRALVLRGVRGGGVLATAVVTSPVRAVRDLLSVMVAAGELAGAFEHVHDAAGDSVIGSAPPTHIAGAETLTETIDGVPLPVLPLAFFQVNPAVLERMVLRLRSEAGHPSRLIDAYCGVGALGLTVASDGAELVGCDVAESAVAAARGASERLGRPGTWLQGRPEDIITTTPEDVVLLDPPRKGCSAAALAALAGGRPRMILYVSCNAASLGRDCERLANLGYAPTALWPADMLPHTPHVEWVAKFEPVTDPD